MEEQKTCLYAVSKLFSALKFHVERFCSMKFHDEKSSYDKLLNWIGLHRTLEGRRIQDMLITINSCFQEKVLTPL